MRQNRQTLAPMRERKIEREQVGEREERNRELMERAEAEARADEQTEEEPDTEHEEIGIVANEINERFGLQKEIHESIMNRMSGLAEILIRGSQPMTNAPARRR
jgi:hypothetical protein